MSFERTIDLYINLAGGTGGALLASAASLARAAQPTWNQGDKFLLRLWFLTPGATLNDAPSITRLDEGAQIAVAGRPVSNLEAEGLLFFATDFAEIEGEEEDTYCYAAELDLNTANLASALQGKATLPVAVNVEIQNADNTQRLTIPKFNVTVLRDVYRGLEGVPLEGDPIYPVPSAIALKAPVDGSYRIVENENGVFMRFYNADTGKYHTLFPSGPDGAVTSNWGPGED